MRHARIAFRNLRPRSRSGVGSWIGVSDADRLAISASAATPGCFRISGRPVFQLSVDRHQPPETIQPHLISQSFDLFWIDDSIPMRSAQSGAPCCFCFSASIPFLMKVPANMRIGAERACPLHRTNLGCDLCRAKANSISALLFFPLASTPLFTKLVRQPINRLHSWARCLQRAETAGTCPPPVTSARHGFHLSHLSSEIAQFRVDILPGCPVVFRGLARPSSRAITLAPASKLDPRRKYSCSLLPTGDPRM